MRKIVTFSILALTTAITSHATSQEGEYRIQSIYIHPQISTFSEQISAITGEEWGHEKIYNVMPGNLIKYQTGTEHIFTQIPQVKKNVEGIIHLLKWYQTVKYDPKMYQMVNHHFQDKKIYCNYAVSIFRSILQEQGFYSRPVILEYNDDRGGQSHTTMEVWDPNQKKWLYVDPHFFAYSKTKSFTETLGEKSQLSYLKLKKDDPALAHREKEMAQLFQVGQNFVYMIQLDKNLMYESRNPKVYAMPPESVAKPMNKNGKRFYHLVLPRT